MRTLLWACTRRSATGCCTNQAGTHLLEAPQHDVELLLALCQLSSPGEVRSEVGHDRVYNQDLRAAFRWVMMSAAIMERHLCSHTASQAGSSHQQGLKSALIQAAHSFLASYKPSSPQAGKWCM